MEETELVALCDIRSERMERYPDKRQYTDFDEMLEKEDIDILDICLLICMQILQSRLWKRTST